MTMWNDDADVVVWLLDDIESDLDAGPVGLYEFVWAIRGRFPDAPPEAMKHVARAALARHLTSPDVALVRLTWGNPYSREPASAEYVNSNRAWDDIGRDKRFLGVERRSDPGDDVGVSSDHS